MRVILLIGVKKLGNAGQIVKVRSGYARNFLIPTKKAIIANKENVLIQKQKNIELEKINEVQLLESKKRGNKLKSLKVVKIYSKSGSKGKLFGSVGVIEIVKAIRSLGIEVEKKEIVLKNGNISYLGVHSFVFRPHKLVQLELTVEVLPKKN